MQQNLGNPFIHETSVSVCEAAFELLRCLGRLFAKFRSYSEVNFNPMMLYTLCFVTEYCVLINKTQTTFTL